MRLTGLAARILVVGAGVMLGACVAQAPAPETANVQPVAFTPPVANWQWSDAGPAVILNANDITASGAPAASLSLVCNNAVPSVVVAWDSPVAAASQSSLSYRFDGGAGRDVSVAAAGPLTQIVSDPLAVSRFIDEAAASRLLVVRAGATAATFSTADDAGNLRRFRTACPDGTN